MNIPLLILPFLLNSLASTTSYKIDSKPKISEDEIACYDCWIAGKETVPSMFNISHLKQCNNNSKVTINKKSEYRCAANIVYNDHSFFTYNTEPTKELTYLFGFTVVDAKKCKNTDIACTSLDTKCTQAYICCDENYCNNPDNIELDILDLTNRTNKYNYKKLRKCLAMSFFKNKEIKEPTELEIIQRKKEILGTDWCKETQTKLYNREEALPYESFLFALSSYTKLLFNQLLSKINKNPS